MDFSRALATIKDLANGTIAATPDLLLALIIFGIFYFVARRTREIVIRVTDKRQKAKNLGLILGKLAQGAVVVAGLLVSLTLLFPSFKPGDLIQLLGIGSVAIGFAFHDLLQNFLAGILLLLTASFKIGDQISVENFEGTVEDIQSRATTIRTYDGRRIVIPNTDLFTHSVTVNTAFAKRCMEYEVGVSYEEDLDRVKNLILDAVNTVDGVIQEPPPEALVVALADSSVIIRIYWWTTMPQHKQLLLLQDKVLTVLKNSLVDSGVELPMPAQQIFLQTQSVTSSSSSSLQPS